MFIKMWRVTISVLKEDSGAVDGIAYVIETYGLIYNKALLKKYCEMDGAVIKSADEIKNFDDIKEGCR